jgi:DNA-binding transcriptional ArsR family regulator
MPVQAGFSKVAALLADPAREAMLVALADGRALPAGELAEAAGVSAQSDSGHLRSSSTGASSRSGHKGGSDISAWRTSRSALPWKP